MWRWWTACFGFALRKMAVCSCRHLGLFCCSELARVLLPGPRRGPLHSCAETWSSWRWRACWEYVSLKGWVGCSGWGQVQHPWSCIVYGSPWCRKEDGDGSLEEAPSRDCRLLGQVLGTYQLGNDRLDLKLFCKLSLMLYTHSLMVTVKILFSKHFFSKSDYFFKIS